jgi:hypothetical protein
VNSLAESLKSMAVSNDHVSIACALAVFPLSYVALFNLSK